MRWHDEERVKDGLLRHPADAKAWEDFDVKHSDFALDPCSVRLGLAIDGLNGEVIDKAILKRTSKYWKNHRYSLRETHFLPETRTKNQTYEFRPDGVNVQNWTNLVDYWFSEDFKKLSKIGKDARATL